MVPAELWIERAAREWAVITKKVSSDRQKIRLFCLTANALFHWLEGDFFHKDSLECFHQFCSARSADGTLREAVFLDFGFVSAQLQAAAGMLLRQSLAKTQKSPLRTATLFFKAL